MAVIDDMTTPIAAAAAVPSMPATGAATEQAGLPPGSGRIAGAWRDLVGGFKVWRIWVMLAWSRLTQAYRRSWIGIMWISLSFGLYAAVKIFIFGALSVRPMEFFGPYLVLGFLSFRLISSFISSGATSFLAMQGWIKSEPLPLSMHALYSVTSGFIRFGFNAVPSVLFCLYFSAFELSALWSMPAVLAIYFVNGVWMSILFGIIGTRHRDFVFALTTIMQIMYFVTPILWVPPETGLRAQLALFNPMTHYINILRVPVMEGTVPLLSWAVVGGCTLIGVLVSFTAFAYARRKIVFWL